MTVIHDRPDQRVSTCGRDQDHRFGVVVSDRIRSPYLRLDTLLDYEYPIVVLPEGQPIRVAAPLQYRLPPIALHAWLCPWGVPDGTRINLWDYFDPNRIITPDRVHPSHRMPPHILDQVAHLL